jgi:uroporphyrinogen-III synthase
MREVGLESNTAAVEFAQRLGRGELRGALLILLTGVGARALFELAAGVLPRERLAAALSELTVLVRGPKPVPVCKEWGVRIDLRAPEPNTWREVLQVLEESQQPLAGRSVLIQEYGAPAPELTAALKARGALVETISVYRWALPVDCEPLREAIRRTVRGEFDVLMFTSAQQVRNVLAVAGELGLEEAFRAAAGRLLIASIGPTTTEALREAGLPQPFEPSHPKMGQLVREACAYARQQTAAGG